jgi:hypothetical protein
MARQDAGESAEETASKVTEQARVCGEKAQEGRQAG